MKKHPAAEKDKKAKIKKKRGAPTKYDPDIHPLKAWTLAQKGMINKEIAAGLRISTGTLDAWQKAHPEFLSAVREGKEVADANVEKALYKLACGFRITEKRCVRNPDGSIRKEVVDKEIPGNPIAQKFWLTNRKGEDWRDKQDVDVNSNTVQILITESNLLTDIFIESLRSELDPQTCQRVIAYIEKRKAALTATQPPG